MNGRHSLLAPATHSARVFRSLLASGREDGRLPPSVALGFDANWRCARFTAFMRWPAVLDPLVAAEAGKHVARRYDTVVRQPSDRSSRRNCRNETRTAINAGRLGLRRPLIADDEHRRAAVRRRLLEHDLTDNRFLHASRPCSPSVRA